MQIDELYQWEYSKIRNKITVYSCIKKLAVGLHFI